VRRIITTPLKVVKRLIRHATVLRRSHQNAWTRKRTDLLDGYSERSRGFRDKNAPARLGRRLGRPTGASWIPANRDPVCCASIADFSTFENLGNQLVEALVENGLHAWGVRFFWDAGRILSWIFRRDAGKEIAGMEIFDVLAANKKHVLKPSNCAQWSDLRQRSDVFGMHG
jgi:hypothetical protein